MKKLKKAVQKSPAQSGSPPKGGGAFAFPDWISESPQGTLLRLWVQPGASRNQLLGPHGTPARLKVKVAAPPVEGAANEEVIRTFADWLQLPRSQVQLLRGATSRSKDLLIQKALREVYTKLQEIPADVAIGPIL